QLFRHGGKQQPGCHVTAGSVTFAPLSRNALAGPVTCYNKTPVGGMAGSMSSAVPQAARVLALRRRLGLSQEQFAMRLGVSFVTLTRWEKGRSAMSAAAVRRLDELDQAPREQPSSRGTPPVPPSSFVGREREIAALLAAQAATRLLSLVGPGGAGKTRPALGLPPPPPAGNGGTLVALGQGSDPAPVENQGAGAARTPPPAGCAGPRAPPRPPS